MDETGFSLYMKEKKNRQGKIDSYIKRVKRFEKYLDENEDGKSIKDLNIEDLKKFFRWCKENNINAYQEFFGIREYYRFLKIKELSYSCNFVMQMIQLEKSKLEDFMTANQEYAKKLAKISLKTASQILEVGKTKKRKRNTSEKIRSARGCCSEICETR